MAGKLTPKQARFVEEYLIDLNATQAAIRAGYSSRSAHVQGTQLLNNPRISAHVAERLAELSRRTGVNQERIMRELARIAFVEPTRIVNMDDATIRASASEDDRAAIQSVKVKQIPTPEGTITEREIRFYDKNRALELLGKRFGMWVERLQADVHGTIEIIDDVPETPSEE